MMRDIQEQHVEEKSKELGFNITPAFYKGSIDDNHLKTFVAAREVQESSDKTITEN